MAKTGVLPLPVIMKNGNNSMPYHLTNVYKFKAEGVLLLQYQKTFSKSMQKITEILLQSSQAHFFCNPPSTQRNIKRIHKKRVI